MMRVIICRIMKEDAALVDTGKGVIQGVAEFQLGVQALATALKNHRWVNCQYSCLPPYPYGSR